MIIRKIHSFLSTFFVLCFLLACPATDEENTPARNQHNTETVHKLHDNENNIEKEESPYFGGLISGQRADRIEQETPQRKIPLLEICDDGNAIDDNFIVSLGSTSFFSKYGSYLASKTKTVIGLSSYSRFEIADWLFEIGKISIKEKRGYGLNGFSTHDCYSNKNIKIKVRFYSLSESGFIKLTITNTSGITDSASGIQQFTDIVEIVHDNFYYGTWCNQYKSKMLRYRPSTSCTVQITLSSVFDNYLYLIDPTSNLLNQNGVDFDDDSGNGTNASITRFLSSSHDYLIVYVQFNPSTNFVNLDDGDNLTIHFERVSS